MRRYCRFVSAALLFWVFGMAALAEEPSAALPLSSDQELAELLRPVPPREPGEALASFELHPEFEIQLVASEPLVASPVAAAFDEDGRLYVAEMRDYPFRPQAGQPPLGRVRLLVDRDGDGRYDVSHVFADELLWPTGVAPWRGGVFVAAAPSIYYLRDGDGDGRADTREIVYTGFGTQNEQGSVNNLTWCFDNFIYGSASVNGGDVRREDESPADAAETAGLALKGRDFRFDPRTRVLEPTSGNSQFGVAIDDWGNRFLCHESDPSDFVVLPRHYLVRNPLLATPRVTLDMAPGVTPIFRASPLEGWRVIRSTRRRTLEERGEQSAGLSHHVIDGAAGPAIYRGQAFGEAFRDCLFVGDAQNNLVHRRRHVPRGVVFDSVRADEGAEFLRSTDNWFRPVNAINAPDGGLYVCDMYRHQIESVHVPLDVWRQVDLTLGRDRGRIWRIVPKGFTQPPAPKLSAATTDELVALLAHPGGWWRDTAQRLLVERQDAAAAPALRALVRSATLPVARVHALYALAALGQLGEQDVRFALETDEAAVREHGLRLAEPLLGASGALAERVLAFVDDDDPRVRMQAAFSLGEIGDKLPAFAEVPAALARLMARDGDSGGGNEWVRAAILSSSMRHAAPLARLLLENRAFVERGEASAVFAQLGVQIGRGDEAVVSACLAALAASKGGSVRLSAVGSLVLGMVSGVQGRGGNWPALVEQSPEPTRKFLGGLLETARALVLDGGSPVADRQQATRLLALDRWESCGPILAQAIEPRQPEWLQRAAIEALGQLGPPEAPGALLAHWRQYLPPLRSTVLDLLLARPEWTAELLRAVETGDVLPQQVSHSQQLVLQNHRDEGVRQRAEALFRADNSPRQEVVERYRAALAMPGEAPRGDRIYLRECAACHRLGERGKAVGPNLALVRNRTPDQLLVHILDPNREVQPAYIQFVVADVHGATHTGLIAADTGNGLTLRRENGAEQTILKEEIEDFSSTEKSLMPEGFERTISMEEMADLLAFIQGLLYDIGTHPGHDEPEGEGPVDPGRLPPEAAVP